MAEKGGAPDDAEDVGPGAADSFDVEDVGASAEGSAHVEEAGVGVSGSSDAEGERALARAFRALAVRDRTEAEMRTLLARRGESEEAVEGAVAELAAGGYLDDAAYARRFADDRRRLDGWGAERIDADLARRGVARELREAAVAEAPQTELEAARAALEARFKVPPGDDRERARAWRFLATRGYASDVAYDAVRQFERGD